jgi:hypothetical protein
MFAAGDLGLPNVGEGKSLRFNIAPTRADRVALVTNLSWSEGVPDGANVGRVRLKARDGRVFEFALRAGADTSEWAHDRPDINARVRHGRAPVASSYRVADASGDYEGHTYVASFALPARAAVTGVEVAPAGSAKWPDLALGLFRVSLLDEAAGRSYPLRRDWADTKPAAPAAAADSKDVKKEGGGGREVGAEKKEAGTDAQGDVRWRLVGRTAQADVYENARALPRAWLAAGGRALGEDATLKVIRTGRLPEGAKWEPLRTALVEPGAGASENVPAEHATPEVAAAGSAEVVRYEPNRVDVKTKSDVPALLVLGENHYPGWRAYLDGVRVEVLRVNYAQRGVRVPAGAHEVSFVYRPKSALVGLLVSLLTAAALLLWWRGLPPAGRLQSFLPRRPSPRGGGNV